MRDDTWVAEMVPRVIDLAERFSSISISILQRHLGLHYTAAAELIESMVDRGELRRIANYDYVLCASASSKGFASSTHSQDAE